MRKSPPAFQIYPRDLLTDPTITDMTPEERGGYFSLVMNAWLRETPGRLPSSPRSLARLAGMSLDEWTRCAPAILRAFEVSEAEITLTWMTRYYAELEAFKRERSESGKKGALGRWGGKETIAQPTRTNGSAMPAMPHPSEMDGSPIDSDGSFDLSSSDLSSSSLSTERDSPPHHRVTESDRPRGEQWDRICARVHELRRAWNRIPGVSVSFGLSERSTEPLVKAIDAAREDAEAQGRAFPDDFTLLEALYRKLKRKVDDAGWDGRAWHPATMVTFLNDAISAVAKTARTKSGAAKKRHRAGSPYQDVGEIMAEAEARRPSPDPNFRVTLPPGLFDDDDEGVR